MTTIEETISRIKTYTIANWDFRYQKISPYVCAQHGYANCGENEIECTVCSVKIKLEDPFKDQEYNPTNSEEYTDFIDNLLRKLKNNHNPDCLFFGLDDLPDIGRDYLFIQGKNIYQDTLYSYTSVENIELPTLNPISCHISYKNDIFFTAQGEKNLNLLFGKLVADAPIVAKTSEILSLFGWRYDNSIEEERVKNEEEQLGPKLCCSFCGRKIYINFYRLNPDVDIHFDQNYAKGEETFEALEEHKYFCAWGGVKDKKSDDQNGWEICLEILIYDKFRGKDASNFDNEISENKENSQDQAHLDLILEQAQFKQEVLNRINDLREFKEKGKRRCEQVLEKLDKLKVKSKKTENLEKKMSEYKVSLEDMIKELNIRVDLVKKIKPNEDIDDEENVDEPENVTTEGQESS